MWKFQSNKYTKECDFIFDTVTLSLKKFPDENEFMKIIFYNFGYLYELYCMISAYVIILQYLGNPFIKQFGKEYISYLEKKLRRLVEKIYKVRITLSNSKMIELISESLTYYLEFIIDTINILDKKDIHLLEIVLINKFLERLNLYDFYFMDVIVILENCKQLINYAKQ